MPQQTSTGDQRNFATGSLSEAKNRAGATSSKASSAANSLQSGLSATVNDLQEKASDMAKQAGDTVQNAREGVSASIDEMKNRTNAAIDQTKANATAAASETASTVREFADAGKNAGAGVMEEIAHVVKDAAGNIEGQAPGVARAARNVADSVETASHDLRQTSIDQIGDGIVEFARKQPIGALCGAFIAGILVTRLMSGSSR